MLAAATEVKSFGQLVGTVQEAIGSGWAQSWEYLLGGFEEAKSMWTNIGNIVNPFLQDDQGTYFDTVLEMERSLGNYRNAMLKTWKDMGGQQALFDGITNSIKFVVNSLSSLREGFREVIGTYKESAAVLTQLTFQFRDFTKSLAENVYIQGTLKSIGRAFGTTFEFVGTVLGKVASGISSVSGSGNGLILTFKQIADGITQFLNGLLQSNNVMTGFVNIGKTIGNVFGILTSIFKIAVTIIGQFFSAFTGGDGSGFKDFTGTLADITGKIREFTEKLEQSIKSVGLFKSMGTIIKGVFDLIGSAFSAITGKFKEFKIPEFNAEGGFFDKLKTYVSDGASGVMNTLGNTFGKIGEFLGKVYGELKGFVKGIGEFLKDIHAADLATAIVSLFAIDKYIKGTSLKEGLVDKIFGNIKEVLGKFTDDAKSFKDSFIEIFDGFGKSLNAFTNMVNVTSLLLIAAAVGILTLSIKELSKMDMPSLSRGLIGVGGAFLILMSGMKKMSAIAAGMPKGGATTMLALAFSMKILASAMKKIAELDTEQVGNALLGLFGAMKIMVMGMKGMSRAGQAQTSIFQMIGMALALRILASAMNALKDFSWEEMIRSALAVGGLMMAMSMSMKLMKGVKVPISTIFSMITMALMMKVLVSAMADVTRLDPARLVDGFTGVIGLMGALVLASRMMSGVKIKMSAMFGMIAFVIAIKGLVSSVKDIAEINPERAIPAMTGVGALLAVLAGATRVLSGVKVNMTAIFSLIAFSGSVFILTQSILPLAKLPLDSLGIAMTAVAAMIAGLIAASYALQGAKPSITAVFSMITFSGGIFLMTLAIKKIADMDPMGLVQGFAGITALLGILIGASHMLKRVKLNPTALITLVALVTTLFVVMQGLQQLANLKLANLLAATAAVAGVLLSVAAASAIISKTSGTVQQAVATAGILGSFASLLRAIGETLEKVAALSWQGVLLAMGSIVAVMVMLIIVLKKTANIDGDVGELVALSAVLYAAGESLSKVAAQPWQGILAATVAMVAVMASLGIAMKAISALPASAAGKLALLAASLVLLAVPIYMLSTLNLVAVGVGLLALAGNLAILLGAAALAGPLSGGLAALSGALLSFGVSSVLAASSILIAGLGFLAFATALATLAKVAPGAFKGIVEGLDVAMQTLAARGPSMVVAGVQIVRNFLHGLAELLPDIVKAGVELITNFLNGMAEAMPQLFSAAVRLLTEFAKSVMENADILVQTGIEIAIKLTESIANSLTKTKDKLVPALEKLFKIILDICLALLEKLVGPLLEGIVKVLQPVVDFIINILKGLSDILAPILEPIAATLIVLFEGLASIIRSVADVLVQLFQSITSIVQSIADVIIQIVQTIESVFTTIGNTIQSFFNTLQTLFMSIASIVQSVIDGIVGAINGFANVIRGIGDAISSIFQGIGQAIQSVLQGIGSIIESVGSAIKSVFEGVGNAAKAFGEGVKAALQGVAEVFRGIGDGIKSAFEGVASIIDAVGNAAKNAGQGFKLFAQGVSIIAKDGIAGAAGITAVAAAVTGLGSASYAGNLVGFTKDLGSLKGVIAGLAGSAGGIMAMSTGFIMMNAALAGLAGTVPTVSSAFQNLQTPITTLAPAIPSLAAAFSMLAPSIMMSASGIMPVVAGFTQLGAIIPSLAAALQTVPAAFQQAAQGAMMFGTSLGQGIMASAPMVIMAVQQLATQAVMSAQMAFQQGQQIGVQFGQQIATGLMSQSGAITSAAQSSANMSINSVRGTFSQGGAIGQQFGSSIASGISGSSGSITGSSSSVANSSVNSIRGVFNQGTSLGSHFGGSVASGISSQSGSAHGAGSSLAHSAYNGASSVSLSSAGSYAGYGFANGLAASAGSIYATASAIASNVAATIRRALDIHSPSRVTKALGKFTGQGFEIGLKDTGSAIFRTAKGLANQAIEALNVDDSLSGLLMDNIDMTIQPTVKPVFDGSLLKDMNNLSGKMNGNLTLPSSYTDRFNQNGNTTITNSDTYTVNVNVENRGNQPINPKELARQVQDELKNMRDAALRSRGEEIAW
nr:MAG TPA: tail tape measure [Caudoviricetes sp.]